MTVAAAVLGALIVAAGLAFCPFWWLSLVWVGGVILVAALMVDDGREVSL